MLKAKATQNDGSPLLILGLEKGNIERLQQDQPILFDLAEVGMVGHCLILTDDTTADIAAKLERHGFVIGAGTA